MVVLDFVGEYNFLEIVVLKALPNIPDSRLPGHIRQHHASIAKGVRYVLTQIFAFLEIPPD